MTVGHGEVLVADPPALLRQAAAYLLGCLPLVTPGGLSRPTPCRGWSLRDLLEHLDESLMVLDEVILDRSVVLVPAAAPDRTADPVARVRDRGFRMLNSWASGDDRGAIRVGDAALPSGVAAAVGALELTVHGWDVAVACGDHRRIPRALARELYSCARVLVSDADRPGRFAAPVRVPWFADPEEQLLAFLGR